MLGGKIDDSIALTFYDAKPVLHGGHGRGREGFFELIQRDIGEANPPDLSLFLQNRKPRNGISEGDIGVDPVKLVKVDAIDSEVSQAVFAVSPQSFGGFRPETVQWPSF